MIVSPKLKGFVDHLNRAEGAGLARVGDDALDHTWAGQAREVQGELRAAAKGQASCGEPGEIGSWSLLAGNLDVQHAAAAQVDQGPGHEAADDHDRAAGGCTDSGCPLVGQDGDPAKV